MAKHTFKSQDGREITVDFDKPETLAALSVEDAKQLTNHIEATITELRFKRAGVSALIPEEPFAYNREQLIGICERAIVGVLNWGDRDTPSAMEQLGRLWALLKCGCTFEIDLAQTNLTTIWVTVYYPNFSWIEDEHDHEDAWRRTKERKGKEDSVPARLGQLDTLENDRFYLPTPEKLVAIVNGEDWY